MLYYAKVEVIVNFEVIYMCDVDKFSKMFKEMKNLEPEDTIELILAADNDEEKHFFEMLGNFLLQERQKKAIAGNMF